VSAPLFMTGYVMAAAALALWADLRFPSARPRGWARMGVVVAATLGADQLCIALAGYAPPLVRVMAVALPAIVCTLLVCIGLLRLMRSAMPA
jgi:hypothetical protein